MKGLQQDGQAHRFTLAISVGLEALAVGHDRLGPFGLRSIAITPVFGRAGLTTHADCVEKGRVPGPLGRIKPKRRNDEILSIDFVKAAFREVHQVCAC